MRNLVLMAAMVPALWNVTAVVQDVSCAEPASVKNDVPPGVEPLGLGWHEEGAEYHALEWSPDGTLIGGVVGRKLFVWNVAKKKAVTVVELEPSAVKTVPKFGFPKFRFSHNGHRCALWSFDSRGTIRVWDIATGKELAKQAVNYARAVDVAFSKDDTELLVAGADGDVIALDYAHGTRRVLRPHAADNRDNSRRRFLAARDQSLITIDGLRSLARVSVAPLTGSETTILGEAQDVSVISRTAISPQGNVVAFAYTRSEIETARMSATVFWRGNPPIRSDFREIDTGLGRLGVASNGLFLFIGRDDGTVELWDTLGRERVAACQVHSSRVLQLAVSPDGAAIATGAKGERLMIWDLPEWIGQTNDGQLALGDLWKNLGAGSSATATMSLLAMARERDASVRWIRTRLVDVDRSAISISQAIDDLDHDEFDRRERATELLEAIGPPCAAKLRAALDHSESPEVRMRLLGILQVVNASEPPPRFRRALAVLEIVGTEEARSAVESLRRSFSQGHVFQLTDETIRRFESNAAARSTTP